jgi:hypothetical protein
VKDISDAADLMTTARDALLRDILPALSGERRYAALMIANSMAIAAREHRLGTDAARSEAARLRNLLADVGPGRADGPERAAADLSALRMAMRAAIRDGAFDAPARADAIARELAHTAADWVAISNPKALRS